MVPTVKKKPKMEKGTEERCVVCERIQEKRGDVRRLPDLPVQWYPVVASF
jgi:hypothetical protein